MLPSNHPATQRLKLRSGPLHDLHVASPHAVLHIGHKVSRDGITELRNILAINDLHTAEDDINNLLVKEEEVLRGAGGTGVGGVQAGDERGWVTSRVELVMDRSHGKDCALKSIELDLHFGGLLAAAVVGVGEETVFEHHSGLYAALHNGEEFRGARVGVGCVH